MTNNLTIFVAASIIGVVAILFVTAWLVTATDGKTIPIPTGPELQQPPKWPPTTIPGPEPGLPELQQNVTFKIVNVTDWHACPEDPGVWCFGKHEVNETIVSPAFELPPP